MGDLEELPTHSEACKSATFASGLHAGKSSQPPDDFLMGGSNNCGGSRMGDLSELLSNFGFDFDLDVELKNSLDQWQDQDIDTKAKQSSDIDQDNDNIGKVDYTPVQLAHNDASANNKAWTDVDTDNDSSV